VHGVVERLHGRRAAAGRDNPGPWRADKATIVASVREHVWPLVESGAVQPVVDRVLPIAAAADAHRVVEASEHVGKVLLQVR